jgi:hypothetical protein
MQIHLEIKRIELWSLFKISFILYAVVGVLVGFFMLFFSLVMQGIGGSYMYDEQFPGFGMLGGVIGIIMIPFFAFLYGIMGSVFATIGGWIFNIVCGMSGGLRFQANTQEIIPPAVAPPVPPAQPPEPPGTQQGPPVSGADGNPQTGGPV